ncbi:hypothetical protein ABT299_40380 [Spirillospora sp. NPDC000708]
MVSSRASRGQGRSTRNRRQDGPVYRGLNPFGCRAVPTGDLVDVPAFLVTVADGVVELEDLVEPLGDVVPSP